MKKTYLDYGVESMRTEMMERHFDVIEGKEMKDSTERNKSFKDRLNLVRSSG